MSYTISEANLERQHVLAEFLKPLTLQAFKNIAIPAGSRILDVGCGIGETSRLLANLYMGIHITGVDQDKALLEIARSKPAPVDSTIEYMEGDAMHLPFEDNHFDFVFSRFLLMHVPDAMATLTEFCRVCKNGGWVFSQEPDFSSIPAYPEIVAYEQLRLWFVRLFRDAFVGRKLVSYSRSAGLQNIGHYVGVSYYVTDNTFKRLATMTAQAMGESLLANKVLSEVEYKNRVDELFQFENDPGTTALSFPVFAVWGTKK